MNFRRAGTPILLIVVVTVGRAAAGPLQVPSMIEGTPAPGKRVKVVPPEYAGTDVYYSLYLPENHRPGGRYPVIVEYTGNLWPTSGSTGEVKDGNLGYAVARRLGAIWVNLPYVQGTNSVLTWWGSEADTIEYALKNIRRICENYGGDPAEVFICGFSRGAIGVNYLGLHNDDIADVWLGFFSHDHYDGEREWRGQSWGSPLAEYRRQARARLERLAGRAALVSSASGIDGIRAYLRTNGWERLGRFTFVSPDIRRIVPGIPTPEVPHPHTDKWLLFPSQEAEVVVQWFADVCRRKPGTFTVSGTIRDVTGKPVPGVVVETGRTHFAMTDENGHYRIEGLRQGPRQVEVGGVTRPVKLQSDSILDFSLLNPEAAHDREP